MTRPLPVLLPIERQPSFLPVKQLVLTGVLSHHFLLKSGALAYQKKPLSAAGGKQRLGYQLLVDESCGAFLDLYLVDENRGPRLELVYAFLALAWACPVCLGPRKGEPMGLPQILSVPWKSLSDKHWSELYDLGTKLGFELTNPQSGFTAGVHWVKAIGKGLDEVIAIGKGLDEGMFHEGARECDWSYPASLRTLSWLCANHITVSVLNAAPKKEFWAAYGAPVAYHRRPLPDLWLKEFARRYKHDSVEEFLSCCDSYFRD